MAPVPTRLLAGVAVPDTPLISAALALSRRHLNNIAYNHSIRAWLFGFIIASKIPSLEDRDLEVHAVAAILHDLGWAEKESGEIVTQEKRFEVDGANGAREFLKGEASDWDKHRVQLVWDAIALHTVKSIAWHKEPEVVATSYGINADFAGPDRAVGGHLSWDEWDVVVKEVPRLGLTQGVREICCRLCREKPDTTYGNFAGQYGERYVEGYTMRGKRSIDFIEAVDLG